MIKVNEIAFVGYPTTDKARARAFYEGVLGFKPTLDLDMGDNYWIEYDIGTSTLAISNYWKPAAEPGMGPMAGLEVEDFNAKVTELKNAGVRFSGETQESSVCFMAMILDPDGNSIWIHKRKPGRDPYIGPEVAFVCYPVTDRQCARDFYEGLLGLPGKPGYEAQEGFWSEYDIGTGTMGICNFWKPAAEPSMAPSIAFEVEDFDTAIVELKAKGVPFPMEPTEFPGCHFSVVTDPDGNSLIIHKRKHSHP
jgi:predicted enzyme related to lactoylglutathione lyase